MMDNNAERKNNWVKDNWTLILGSVLIALINLIIMAVYKCAPFGDYVFSRGDNLVQILPYIEELKNKISSGESLAYSWHIMGGSNFYYLFCYTLTSPTMLPLILLPMKYYAATLGLCIVGIAVLMFLSMSYYLTHRVSKAKLDKNQPEVLLFGMAYGLLPAFVSISGYYPYLGVFVLVPLLMLGLERFVANLGWRMYFITLALIMFFNFYIGGMVCIFTVLYYLTLSFKNAKEFFVKSLKIICMSIMALGVAAVLLIPVACVAFNGGLGFSEYLGIGFFQGWFEVLEQSLMFNDVITTSADSSNYWDSNLYVGLLVEILALTYFFNKNIRFSVRFRKLIVFVIMLFTFNESTCNYVMHLFHYTVSNPNRQTIFFLFYMIVLAQESFTLYKENTYVLSKIRLIIPVALMVVVDVGAVIATQGEANINMYLYSFDFILGYGILLLLKDRFKTKETFAISLTVILIAEMGWNYTSLFGYFENAKKVSDTVSTVKSVVKDIDDDSFYRTEYNDYSSIMNSGELFNTNSIAGLSGVANESYLTAINNLGIKARVNAVYGSGFNPVLNALFAKKYIVEPTSDNDDKELVKDAPFEQYELISSDEGYNVYENTKCLSPIIIADTDMKNYEEMNASSDATGLPNKALLADLCGADRLLKGTPVDLEIVKTVNCNATVYGGAVVVTQAVSGKDNKYNPNKNSVVTIKVTTKEAGDYYFDFGDQYHAGFIDANESREYSFSMARTEFNEVFGFLNYYFDSYTFDNEKFNEVYEELADRQMSIDKYTSNSITGTLKSNGDHPVFTTIPYDSAWEIKVDGKVVETKAVADAFLSFDVTDGEHNVIMTYKNRGFVPGLIISIIFMALGLFMIIYFKKGKYCFWLEKGVFIDDYEYVPGERSALAKFLSEALEDDEEDEDKEADDISDNKSDSDDGDSDNSSKAVDKPKKKSKFLAFLEDDDEEDSEEDNE